MPVPGPSVRVINREPQRIALRLWDLSEWSRQVVRGVQKFAHGCPNWRLFVDTGTAQHARLLRGDIKWDGVITAVSGEAKQLLRMIKKTQMKVVVVSAVAPASLNGLAAVRVDDFKVAEAIGKHFAASGLRRIGYVANTQNVRARGIEQFAAAHGFPCDIYSQKATGPIHMPSLIRWIKKLPKPAGVAAWNMEVALNTLEACQRNGISVPEEVAVVAWDDDQMLAESVEPTISAVVLPAERLGYEGARQLQALLNGQPVPAVPVLIPPSGVLRVRQSSDTSTLVDRDVNRAVQYIREHAAECIKIANLAAILGVSRRKLEQDFKRVTGQTLHEAITQVCMERAKQLLLETDWAMVKIARASGLGTLRTMYRAFAAWDQCTPAEYRQRWGKSLQAV